MFFCSNPGEQTISFKESRKWKVECYPEIDLFHDSNAISKMLCVELCGKVYVNSDTSSETV